MSSECRGPKRDYHDVVIIGAGGAGMMCAIHAASRGRKVALIDHSIKVGGKILISGGGRCNFTNIGATFKNYVSKNEHFCKSAMSRYLPQDFIEMVKKHEISFHEKKLGQLFCDSSAQQIINMLVKECELVGAGFYLNHKITTVEKSDNSFIIKITQGDFKAQSLVIATGGLSIPKTGATGFGYDIARQFGINIVETSPALDGFIFSDDDQKKLGGLSGLSQEVIMTCNGISFRENLLFTHLGFSGPAALQSSLHWYPGNEVTINFVPQLSREELFTWFTKRKTQKTEVRNLMAELMPKRLAEKFCELYLDTNVDLANITNKALEEFCDHLQRWVFVPSGTVGYSKAEVTRGGVDTDELSSKTMESKKVKGLYFIGEVVDVTGWLGGYNFQWAWASGWAAGQSV